MAKVKTKKRCEFKVAVKHTVQWFIDRVGKQIFKRVQVQDPMTGVRFIRKYVLIESPAHAQSLYTFQNTTNIKFFDK